MIRLNPKGPPSWIQKGRFLAPAPTSVGAPLVGALVLAPNLDRTSKRPIVDRKVFFASLSDPSRIRKVFSVALRGPSWIQKGRFLAPAPTSVGAPLVGALVLAPNLDRTSKRPIVDRKVFFATLRDPSRIRKVFSVALRGPSWIQKGRFLAPAPTSVGAPLVGALVLAPNLDPTSKRPIVDRKVFFASLSDPTRIRKVFSVALRGPSWIQKGRFLAPAPTSVGAPLVGALVLAPNLDRTSKRPIVDRKVFFASLSDPSRIRKVFSVALRGPSWIQKGRFLAPAPTSVGAPLVGALVLAPNLDRTSKRPIVDRKVFFASLSDPSRIRKVFSVALRGPSWIQKGRFLAPAPTSVGAPLEGALVLAPNLDRISKRPIVDRKVFFRVPSRPFADKKGVLRGPSRPFVDPKGAISSPCANFGRGAPCGCPGTRAQSGPHLKAAHRGQKGVLRVP